jgi:hypothetical protein
MEQIPGHTGISLGAQVLEYGLAAQAIGNNRVCSAEMIAAIVKDGLANRYYFVGGRRHRLSTAEVNSMPMKILNDR